MLSNVHYYHRIVRKMVVAFGTLFNNIKLVRYNQAGTIEIERINVPISYANKEKFYKRISEDPNLANQTFTVLPRISFEMTSIQYDSTRKANVTQTFKTCGNGDTIKKVYMPVPYNIGFQLSIMTKLNDDMLQIVEQILPAFQPSFSLTINLISSIGEKKDIPIILEGGVNMEDNYEGNYTERRALVYTLNFTAKAYLFGPIPDSTDGIIKKVQVDYYTDTNTKNASRQLRYTATPRALKDYNNDNTTTLAENIDDKVTVFNVSSAVSLVNDSYIMIGNEEMYIKDISGNILTVLRGQDGTSIESHNEGDSIDAITTADNELVEMDDDFGFSESRFDFGDGKVYSTTKGIDVSL